MHDLSELNTYLLHARQYGMLTADETVRLIKIAQAGRIRVRQRAHTYSLGDKATSGKKILGIVIKASDRNQYWYMSNKSIAARNKVIEANLKLVIYVARRYMSKYPNVSYGDLVSWGNFGLFHAIEKFDVKRNIQFSTYAYQWIMQYIRREGFTANCTLTVPAWVSTVLAQYCYILAEAAEKQTVLSEDEIIKKLAVSKAKYKYMKQYFDTSYVSLEQPISSDGDSVCLKDVISGVEPVRPSDLIEYIDTLSADVAQIIKLAYGFSDGVPHTPEWIADHLRRYGVPAEAYIRRSGVDRCVLFRTREEAQRLYATQRKNVVRVVERGVSYKGCDAVRFLRTYRNQATEDVRKCLKEGLDLLCKRLHQEYEDIPVLQDVEIIQSRLY